MRHGPHLLSGVVDREPHTSRRPPVTATHTSLHRPPLSPVQIMIRWLTGTLGVAMLALLMWVLVHDALTVVARAKEAGVSGGAQARDWDSSAVALSALVIAATLYRVLTRSRRPSLPVLWLAGGASVCWSLLAGAASASCIPVAHCRSRINLLVELTDVDHVRHSTSSVSPPLHFSHALRDSLA